ncbi:MAG: FAD-dependent oxidoreductase [Rhodothermales bacterium]|nr:FAD-dependent oxidoreductase [Rhodothermales bacterium]
MPDAGTPSPPLRVAIVGAGPAGFYAAGHLFKQERPVEVDLYDKLPTPHGLVRAGVAPDHQKIKSVTRVYDKIAAEDGFRFFGNVTYGKHLGLDDLRRHYHAVVFTTGAQVDRRLGIPGEDLGGSHSATDFVAWYNGHPDYRHLAFDLSAEHVVVVGVGNVAVDVARILCRTPEELAATDIADYALEALRASGVRTVTMLGRRGPAQAAFTNPEVKELGELEAADVYVPPDEATPDALSRAHLDAAPDRLVEKKLGILEDFATRAPSGKPKRLVIRFLVSPTEILDDGRGRVGGVRVVRNALYETDDGRLRPRATDRFEDLPAGLVFRSIGYRGVPLEGLPFDARWGVVPNTQGRVVDPETQQPVPGLYVAGWIKRGATGVIGTNKADAVETIDALLEDVAAGRHLAPPEPAAAASAAAVRRACPDYFSYADWQRIDALETEQGAAQGRPRVKYVCAEDMLAALGRGG